MVYYRGVFRHNRHLSTCTKRRAAAQRNLMYSALDNFETLVIEGADRSSHFNLVRDHIERLSRVNVRHREDHPITRRHAPRNDCVEGTNESSTASDGVDSRVGRRRVPATPDDRDAKLCGLSHDWSRAHPDFSDRYGWPIVETVDLLYTVEAAFLYHRQGPPLLLRPRLKKTPLLGRLKEDAHALMRRDSVRASIDQSCSRHHGRHVAIVAAHVGNALVDAAVWKLKVLFGHSESVYIGSNGHTGYWGSATCGLCAIFRCSSRIRVVAIDLRALTNNVSNQASASTGLDVSLVQTTESHQRLSKPRLGPSLFETRLWVLMQFMP
mmetsp:Transcript_58567/g.79857  ORF Transcript_58567/g.79857 Transcript_58567/m.79857 type:complete len:324 (+) Transcript_58567:668-1639(+)